MPNTQRAHAAGYNIGDWGGGGGGVGCVFCPPKGPTNAHDARPGLIKRMPLPTQTRESLVWVECKPPWPHLDRRPYGKLGTVGGGGGGPKQ